MNDDDEWVWVFLINVMGIVCVILVVLLWLWKLFFVVVCNMVFIVLMIGLL